MPKLTPAQRQYVRKRTKIVELDPSEMMGELNIIPFLDIVVNLIMFLLVTIISAISMSQIDSQLPEYRRGVGARSSEPEATLNLNITVVEAGVIVTGSGAKLAPGCNDTASGNVITVPRRGNGEYDWPALTECASNVKREFPEERQVIVTADPLIHYEHVVRAMDAVRQKSADEELFPEVLISAGVR